MIPWNPKRQKNRSSLPPTWTREELGKRSGIERFFGRVFLFFHLQRPPLSGWSTMVRQVALTYTATSHSSLWLLSKLTAPTSSVLPNAF